jgi:hypothetical protein
VQLPKAPQGLQCWVRERHLPVLIALAPYAQHLALAIHIPNLHGHAFADTQTAPVNGAQASAVDWSPHTTQNRSHFRAAQDHRQPLFFARSDQAQNRPGLLQGDREHKPDARNRNLERTAGAAFRLCQVQKIGA